MDQMMCAICGRALNMMGDRFIHPAKDAQMRHDPVPVPMGTFPPRLRCDFCSGENPTKYLPAKSFQTPIAGSMGNWACCDICAGFIEAGDWEKVVDRAAKTAPSNLRKMPGIKKLYREIYSQLQDNITGPVQDL